MELSFDKVKPYVRFALKTEASKDYREFLYAYDYRLFYMQSGAMRFEFYNKNIDMKDGDLLIFPPEIAYRIKYEGKKSSKYIILNFDFDYIASDRIATPPQPAKNFEKNKVISRAYCQPFDKIFFLSKAFYIENELTEIFSDIANPDQYSKENIAAVMKHLLAKIIRASQQHQKSTSQNLCDEIINFINLNYMKNVTNITISEHFGYHPYYLNSIFSKHVGMTLHSYIMKIRLKNAQNALLFTNNSIKEIAEQCGFSGQSYFSECFKSAFGMSPREYRMLL